MQSLEEVVREALRLPDAVELTKSSGPGTVEGWDSLGHAALITALESAYRISLTMDEVLSIESLADIESLLERRNAAC